MEVESLYQNMKKYFVAGAAVLLCGLVLGQASPAQAEETPKVVVNGQGMTFPDQQPIIENSRTMVPIRFISEALGAHVEWTGGNQQVHIQDGNSSLILDLGRQEVAKNGNLVTLDTYPILVNNRVMVPLRFVSEQMGLKVDWHEDLRLVVINGAVAPIGDPGVVLGNERLLTDYHYLVKGKRVGLVTNQTGVNRNGVPTPQVLLDSPDVVFAAAYSPEHGLDGTAPAGAYVDSYWDSRYNVPVHSLYGVTREPSAAMCAGIDVFVFDMQDIGSRTYTYMSTMNYVMRAGAKYGIPVVVLDRPNPLGGEKVEGYMMEDRYQTFVGVDRLPLQHGMTAGELALYFNRKIGADLRVVPMQGYNRQMIWQDTGLPFMQTSPNIPNLDSAFRYIATGMGDGTGIGQGDKFHWIGASGIQAENYAAQMNAYGLPGVWFSPEWKGDRGGVRVNITDYHTFNPTQTTITLLLTADRMRPVNPPSEGANGIPMFEKIWGGTRFSQALLQDQTPAQAIASYQDEVNAFRATRAPYLLYY